MGTANAVKDPIVLFDGVCNLCNRSVTFIIDHEIEPKIKFAALQSKFAKQLLNSHHINGEAINSIVLIESEHKVYLKSKAVLRLSKYLNRPISFVQVFSIIPSFISDTIYDLIARNRYHWFGNTATCRVPTPELKNRFIDSAILS